MASPIFNAMGGNTNGMISAFQAFMQSMKGQNPQEILNGMIQSGKISQQQLNAAQEQARQMGGMFNGVKGMFGFK